MYHRVLPDELCADYPLPSLAMPESAFRAQLRWLSGCGEVLPLGQALERSREHRARPCFAITIDDGYEDAARIAAVALEEAGLRATFFVTTGFIGSAELLWFDKAVLQFARVGEATRREILRHLGLRGHSPATASAWLRFLKRCRPRARRDLLAALEQAAGASAALEQNGAMSHVAMSIDQLVELDARGHEIGSHTVTHALLPELDDLAGDAAELRERLEQVAQLRGA